MIRLKRPPPEVLCIRLTLRGESGGGRHLPSTRGQLALAVCSVRGGWRSQFIHTFIPICLLLLLFFCVSSRCAQTFLCCLRAPSDCNVNNPCEGLSRHATFENFGMAFLTLFRVSTGDNWNGIMKVRTAQTHTDVQKASRSFFFFFNKTLSYPKLPLRISSD